MLTKTILGEAIGVQHGGIQDRTSSNTVQGITHGLIIGKFKRGRTDQPMRINKDTIKARLGYEPNNPFYQVVQDCVDRFPSVWVLRVSEGENVTSPVGQISCEGATDRIGLNIDVSRTSDSTYLYIDLVVNSQKHRMYIDPDTPSNNSYSVGTYIEQYLSDKLDVYYVGSPSVIGIGNKTNQNIRLYLSAGSNLGDGQGSYSGSCYFINDFDAYTTENPNPTISTETVLGVSSVCLAPTEQNISCSLTEVIFIVDQSWNGMDESGYEKSIKLYDATTNQLLAFSEDPITADNGDYSNILPDFVISVNESNHELHAEYFIDENNDKVVRIRSTSNVCKKLRLEVFIGNEGRCIAKTVPSNPADLVIINPIDYEDFLVTPVIALFCLCYSDIPPQATFLRLQPSEGNTLFSGEVDDLTLINSANQIVYGN